MKPRRNQYVIRVEDLMKMDRVRETASAFTFINVTGVADVLEYYIYLRIPSGAGRHNIERRTYPDEHEYWQDEEDLD